MTLSDAERAFAEACPDLQDGLEACLKELVCIESFHQDLAGCRAVAERVARELTPLGLETWIEVLGQRKVPALVARTRRKGPGGILLLGHTDTVHPPAQGFAGYQIDQDDPSRATGPGAADMKGGIAVMIGALRLLAAAGELEALPLTVLLVGDEELGSPDSEEAIRAEARRAALCLCFEAGRPMGGGRTSFVTRRRGCGQIDLLAEGVAAHAGVEPWRGASALLELATKVAPLTALTDRERDLTVTVGEMAAGTSPNTVPARATMSVDYRFSDEASGRALKDRIEAILAERTVRGEDGAARVKISRLLEARRVALERTPEAAAAAELLRATGRGLGLELLEETRGGSSDAALATEVGCPALCGLGVVGDRFHTTSEWIQRESLAQRAKLTALFIRRYGAAAGARGLG